MNAPLTLRFSSREALVSEHDENLAHGRAFVSGASGLLLFSKCTLLIEHPDTHETLAIDAEVVNVLAQGGSSGVALQFTEHGESARARLQAFVERALEPVSGERMLCANDTQTQESELSSSERTSDEAGEHEADEGEADDHEPDEDEAHDKEKVNFAQERQLRLRNLSLADRMKVARGPIMEERVLLERIYGTAVWEHLLRNPKISIGEVARLAKKGTMPQPLLDIIVENESWIRQGVIRRALLTNPRLSSDGALRVLRVMPARELKLVPQNTAYPAIVRAVASRLVRGS